MIENQAFGLLRRMFDAAIASADPARVLARHLPKPPRGRCIVVGAGKSSAAMAAALERAWPDVALGGLVVTRYGHSVPTRHIEVLEASHPRPDPASEHAAARIMQTVRTAGPDDLVIALISGGGSALMAMPRPPLTLDDKIATNSLLLRSGLDIAQMNAVRRRLSLIKGGGLARAVPAGVRLVTLAISDVPGDDPAAIASGPTWPGPAAGAQIDLPDLARRLGPDLPEAARRLLERPDPVTGDDGRDATGAEAADYRLIATPQAALLAAADCARQAGITPIILGDALEGEARELGIAMAGIARSVARHGQPAPAPAVLLSGGETTVTLQPGSAGRGGRNTEFLLSLGCALSGHAGIFALAGDTDGIDGTEDAAGAVLGPETLDIARRAGLDPLRILRDHDSYRLFDTTQTLIRTGPTLTNVNDFRAVLVTPEDARA